MPLETSITAGILKYLNSLDNCVAEKIAGNAMQKDKPDINGCWKGHSFKIEVKSPDHNNKPTKGQILELKKWAKAGCYCLVVYSISDVKAFFNDEGVFYKSRFKGQLISCEGGHE